MKLTVLVKALKRTLTSCAVKTRLKKIGFLILQQSVKLWILSIQIGTLDDSGNIATITLHNSPATTATKLQDYEAAETKKYKKNLTPCTSH